MGGIETLSIDIETFSPENLSKSGVYRYAEAPDFRVLLFGCSVNGGPVRVYELASGEELPKEILAALTDESVLKCAFNASFERVCLSRYLRDLGLLAQGEFLSPAGWRCTMIRCAYLGLPLSLANAGAVLGLDKQKLTAGKELIRFFCLPAKPSLLNGQSNRNGPSADPNRWQQFVEYNRRDVEVEMQIQERLKNYPVPESVWKEYELDQEINDRGILVDDRLVSAAFAMDEISRNELTSELSRLTQLSNVRAVTRKVFTAAVARIYCPGTKFDSVLVLDGAQGIGKSTLFRLLTGPKYYSETLSLTDMNDKAGAEKLQGYWIAEIGELAGMKKADIEKVKAFLSTADDMYRPSYGKVVESHPRQTVIIATVNGERGYLRDVTGNRRFWIVKCRQKEPVRKFSFTDEERDQIWAEAKYYWQQGEKLYLEGDLIRDSEEAQRSAMEADERQGMVEQYLDTLLPLGWNDMDLYERRNWLADRKDPTQPTGTERREKVCNAEIWAECFGRNPSDMKPADSYAIAALMSQVPGWRKAEKRIPIPIYGRQRGYERIPDLPDFLD